MKTRHRRLLASPPVRLALALPLDAAPLRSTSDPSRRSRPHPRDASRANPFWGAPHIHGELRKLGIEIAETTVAKYLGRRLALADLAHVPADAPVAMCVDGLFHGPNGDHPRPVRPRRPLTRSPPYRSCECDRPSDRRVDGAADPRSLFQTTLHRRIWCVIETAATDPTSVACCKVLAPRRS